DGTLEGATSACGPKGEVYIVWAGQGKLWFDRSLDGGKHFGKDREIATLTEGWTLDIPGIYRTNGMPFIACDPISGRLYVSYADRVNGKTTVMLMFSDDQGVSWHTLPVSAGREGHAFFPNICIHPEKQVLGMVYYQTDRK